MEINYSLDLNKECQLILLSGVLYACLLDMTHHKFKMLKCWCGAGITISIKITYIRAGGAYVTTLSRTRADWGEVDAATMRWFDFDRWKNDLFCALGMHGRVRGADSTMHLALANIILRQVSWAALINCITSVLMLDALHVTQINTENWWHAALLWGRHCLCMSNDLLLPGSLMAVWTARINFYSIHQCHLISCANEQSHACTLVHSVSQSTISKHLEHIFRHYADNYKMLFLNEKYIG